MPQNNPQQVNYYIDEQMMAILGYSSRPKEAISGTISADDGNLIYAIEADGAADLVISAASYNGTAYAGGLFPKTIKAGTVSNFPCSSFTISTGKGMAFQKKHKPAA